MYVPAPATDGATPPGADPAEAAAPTAVAVEPAPTGVAREAAGSPAPSASSRSVPPSDADAVRIGTATVVEPTATASAPVGPVSWEDAPTAHLTTGPYAGCAVRRYESGWIVGRCGGLELFIQAGFAGSSGPATLRGVAGDRMGGWVEPRRFVIAGRSAEGAELVRREPRRVESFLGTETRPDRNGRTLGRGIHARLRTPGSGPVGATCHADLGAWDEAACLELFEKLARHGLPGGPVTERRLTVAGVELDFTGERCWSPDPHEVYCFLDGGLTWTRGAAERMIALREESIRRAPLAPRSEEERQRSADTLNASRERIHALTMVSELERTGRVTTTEAPTFHADDFPRLRVERGESACRIGGVLGECTRVDYYGALDHPAEYAYYARVPSGEDETLVHCRHNHDELAPTACRQVFGSFVVSPTTR